jgi:hypothetical protein
MFNRKSIPQRFLVVAAATVTGMSLAAVVGSASATAPAPPSRHLTIRCEYSTLCPDIADSRRVYGKDEYVGHDEPSLLFYSNRAGSGNRMQYELSLPRDPTPAHPTQPGKGYNFELNGALWFGMALCDNQSYPEQVSTCTPDSDRNIVDPAVSPDHPGTAFLELQFYPPGWVPWPTWAVAIGADTCSPTKWCAAMNVFSLLEDPVAGTLQNPTCAAKVGVETFQFAFVTKSGKSHAPANPIDSTLATFTPNPRQDLFMNSGDRLRLRIHDTPEGVQAQINDLSNNKSGSMTASPANGFGQIKFDPTGNSCTLIPYAFHPMYSTASEQTRVIWAAHSYNVAFSEEIGHFDYCTAVDPNGNCTGLEGAPGDQEPADGDDNGCFPASASLLVQVSGCEGTNDPGFDGTSYLPDWPDGNPNHPTPQLFSSPLTGPAFNTNYRQAAFESDAPRIEAPDFGGNCDRSTGAGCTIVPPTDDGQPAAFYPFYSITTPFHPGGCRWFIGNDVPGLTLTDFGKDAQYGALYPLSYLVFGGGGATHLVIDDFHKNLANPCPV